MKKSLGVLKFLSFLYFYRRQPTTNQTKALFEREWTLRVLKEIYKKQIQRYQYFNMYRNDFLTEARSFMT